MRIDGKMMLLHLYLFSYVTKADARDKIVKIGIVSDVIRRWANGLKRVQIFDPILPAP